MSFFRRISPIEASYLAKDKLGKGQFINQFFLEGELTGNAKEIDVKQWKAAIEKASDKNPAIFSQLRGFWGFRYWKTVKAYPDLILYDDIWDGESSNGFENAVRFINPRKGTNASIIIFNKLKNQTANKVIILFRIHHGLCDGAATAHWIQEIFRALRGEALLASISNLNETDIIKRTPYPKPDTFRGRCLPLFPVSQKPEAQSCHWVKAHWHIDNTRILAKLILALRKLACEQHGNGKTVFRLTSDLRHYLSEEEKSQIQFSNLSGIFDIAAEDADTVKSIQFKIIRALRKHRDLSVFPKRMVSLIPWLPGSLFNLSRKDATSLHKRGICNITAMIGYANHIDLNAVSCSQFRATGAFAIPMNIEDKSLFIGIASTPNGLDLILSAPNALSSIENTRILANKIEKIISEMDT